MKAFYSHVHGRAFPPDTHTRTQSTANVLQAICVSIYSGWRGERERKGSVGGGQHVHSVTPRAVVLSRRKTGFTARAVIKMHSTQEER